MNILGMVKKQISNNYVVVDLKSKKEYNSIASGKLRYIRIDKDSSFNKTYGRNTKKEQKIVKISPKVGDHVVLEIKEEQNIIVEIKERKNDLVRPDVSNIDQVLLVFSAVRPEFSFNLLDQFLVILEEQNLYPVLVVTKIDLVEEKTLLEIKEKLKYYEKNLDLNIYYINSKQRIGFDVLTDIFKNKLTVLAGQTGVGKSTLLNALMPKLDLKTQEISMALGRGKHTTRHSELYDFNEGYICDTPGFSKIEINIFEKEELKNLYKDFKEISNMCKFSSCNHINEPGCEVRKDYLEGKILKERYETYLKLYKEIESKKNKY